MSGQTPFVDRPDATLFAQHLRDAPRSLSSFGIPVPDQLDDLVLQLLAKKPHERPHSVADVLAAFAPHLPRPGTPAPRPTLTPDPTAPFRLGKSTRTPAPELSARSGTRGRTATTLTRREIEAELAVVGTATEPDDASTCARLRILLETGTRSLGRPHVLVARVELRYADSLKLLGECGPASEHYGIVMQDVAALTHRSTEATYLHVCARLGQGECHAAMGDLDDGLTAWKEVADTQVAPEHMRQVDERRRDLGLQLIELEIDDHAVRSFPFGNER